MKPIWRKAWLGLGGNLGDVRGNMRAALQRLAGLEGIRVEQVSPLYATPPWGKTDQPEFLNACAAISTALPPRETLNACLDTETALNRVRDERWGPRTIDIDLLAVEGVELCEDGLSLPHPRLHERAFVLVPLADIAPDLVVAGQTIAQWCDGADLSGIRMVAGAAEWFGEG